jgi:tRNA pseudouridine38-40 synthase
VDKETLDKLYSYKISEERLAYVNGLLKQYEGVHNFKNFTKEIKLLESEKSPNRLMYEVRIIEVKERHGIEFVRVYLKGQSFLYNQIRKMMGAILKIISFGLPESYLELCFNEEIK